ncbi:MAG: carboxypeptidase-like regulatory domain-containing protein, partial [Spirochaetes bacterium]|nr:carboxypeptidase-like regulatory domain-containing protein [Spirochaetota bacterium]
MMKKISILMGFFLFSTVLPAQAKISLKGIVTDSMTRKPVDMATVMILETKTKAYTDEYGRYNVIFTTAGTYTLLVKADGNQLYQEMIVISAPEERNIVLKPLKVQGGAITIKGDRDIQKISRHSLSNKEIKAIPAAFGDSLSALTALPNVMRTDGMFGPLIIRGASPDYNGYLVDNIPIYNPYHFGGLHSIINTNIIDEIDLYSSSFPAHFGNAQSAVINVNTVDDVKKFGGYADISMLYSSVVLKAPLKEKYYEDGLEKSKNNGYVVFAGRIGYISLFLKATKKIYEMMGKDVPSEAPQYGDYQIKIKRNINDRNAISFLAFGSFDQMKFVTEEETLSESDDPYLTNIKFKES